MYKIEFDKEWDKYFEELPKDMQIRIWKKINKIKEGISSRHLGHGIGYFVAEIGQYRICYKSFENEKIVRFYFAGKHKDYERWYGGRK